ncbi:MAG: hypothetical protein V3S11_05880 [Elusimicrobiota bacterium]
MAKRQRNSPATKADIDRLEAKLDTKFDAKSGAKLGAKLDAKLDAKVGGLQGRLDEVREDLRRVAVDQAKTHGKMHDMEQRLTSRIDQGVSKVLDAVTSFAGQVQTVDRRQVITSRRVDDLERRMGSLEGGGPSAR